MFVLQLVDLLLSSQADGHHLDSDGRTALSLACLGGHPTIVRRFLDLGEAAAIMRCLTSPC